MPQLPDLLREYGELLEQEQYLARKKAALRAMIEEAMALDGVAAAKTEFGSAQYQARHTLIPRRQAVLDVLDRDDLFSFAQFSAAKITKILVPKYGRDRLIPLFDVKKTQSLVIKRPPGAADDAQ
jgi:hypothetical protein